MSLSGSPFMPELDVRLDTIEDNRVTDAAAIAVLQTASIDLSASANLETSTGTTGAISIVKPLTVIDGTAGAGARTLAAPSATSPLVKIIRTAASANDTTIAGTNILGRSGSTATFADIGDTLVLVNNGSTWSEVSLSQGGVTWA